MADDAPRESPPLTRQPTVHGGRSSAQGAHDAGDGGHTGGRGVMRTHVRWSDVDLFGHVNNAAYLRYLDDARFALFDMGVDADGQLTSSRLVVVKHEIDYLARLSYRPQPIDVEVWVPRIGRTSVDVAYEVVGVGVDLAGAAPLREVYLRARTRMVQLDAASGAPRAFTATERAAFAAYPGEGPDLRAW